MSAILAIETSAHVGAVTLLPDTARVDSAISETIRDDAKLSAWLLPAINRVISRWGGNEARIDAVAFGAGPGSFTGVRTACATAQALAFAWQKPLLAVDSLEALALRALDESPRVTVALDARMGEVYVASFARSTAMRVTCGERLDATAVSRPGDVVLAGDALLLGSGAPLVIAAQPNALQHAVSRERNVAFEDEWALGVARVAASMLRRGLTVDPLAAEPIYVRNNVALTEAERLAHRRASQAVAA